MPFEVMERRCSRCGTYCPCKEYNGKNYCLPCYINELQAENERLKAENDRLEEGNAKLRYALARLRWEHAGKIESLIDEIINIRPSCWRFYHKSKVYWYGKCQELKKKLTEGK